MSDEAVRILCVSSCMQGPCPSAQCALQQGCVVLRSCMWLHGAALVRVCPRCVCAHTSEASSSSCPSSLSGLPSCEGIREGPSVAPDALLCAVCCAPPFLPANPAGADL